MYSYVLISKFSQWNFSIHELFFIITTRQLWCITETFFPIILSLPKLIVKYCYSFIRSFYIDLTINWLTSLLVIIGIETLRSKRSVVSSGLFWASYGITKVYLIQNCLSFEHFSSLDSIFFFFSKDV